jgi:hypothetical protein
LNSPSALAFIGTTLYIADADNCVIRVVNFFPRRPDAVVDISYRNGLIRTAFGKHMQCFISGDGRSAVNATFAFISAMTSYSGSLYLADTDSYNVTIRVISPTGIIRRLISASREFEVAEGISSLAMLSPGLLLFNVLAERQIFALNVSSRVFSVFAGTGNCNSEYIPDRGALQLELCIPSSIAVRNGDVFFTDLSIGLVFQISTGATSLCPAGYYCECGRHQVACSNSTFFCPARSKSPQPVSTGYSVVQRAGVSVAQRRCGPGFFCPGGVLGDGDAHACPAGTFGWAKAQSTVASCSPCSPHTYSSAVGQPAADFLGTGACRACPPGTVANATGAIWCDFCPPGTYSLASKDGCLPCPGRHKAQK